MHDWIFQEKDMFLLLKMGGGGGGGGVFFNWFEPRSK